MQIYMGQEDVKSPKGVEDPNLNSLFLRVIVKTTIIMFVPTLGLFGIGGLVDYLFATTPAGMFIGVIVGFVIAIFLLVRLIRNQKKTAHQKQENKK